MAPGKQQVLAGDEGVQTVEPDALRAAAAAARDARMADRDAAAADEGDDEEAGGKRTRAADGSAAKPDFPRLKQQAVRAALPARA